MARTGSARRHQAEVARKKKVAKPMVKLAGDPFVSPPQRPKVVQHMKVPEAGCRQCGAKAPLLELLGTQFGMKVPIDLRRRLICNQCRKLNERVQKYVLPTVHVTSQMEMV